jgi:hypothetical protein
MTAFFWAGAPKGAHGMRGLPDTGRSLYLMEPPGAKGNSDHFFLE